MPQLFVFPSPFVLWSLAALFITLTFGSIVRYIGARKLSDDSSKHRLDSLKTWWILAFAFSVAVFTGRIGICVLMASASVFSLREYLHLIPQTQTNRIGQPIPYLISMSAYVPIMFGFPQLFLTIIPFLALVLLTLVPLFRGETKEYLRDVAGQLWGVLVLGYCLAHAALLVTLPAAIETNRYVDAFVFLIVATQTNDIAQALIGRSWGAHERHRIAPLVSPHKTWEGFLGGLAVSIVLAMVLAPFLIPRSLSLGSLESSLRLSWSTSALAGLLIAVSGFLGDINMSAVKRYAGVKDSGDFLPGMGGMIDRVDSLTLAAPVFYYFLLFLDHGLIP